MPVYRCRSPTNLILGQTYLKQLIYKVVESERELKFLNLTFLCLIFLVGCAPNVHVLDRAGREMPAPSYILTSDSPPIQVIFYLSKIKVVKDLDKTDHKMYSFIDPSKHIFQQGEKVELTMEILNPSKQKYKLVEVVSKNSKPSQRVVALSDLFYRVVTLYIPTTGSSRNIDYSIRMFTSKGPIMMVIHLNYQLKGGTIDYLSN